MRSNRSKESHQSSRRLLAPSSQPTNDRQHLSRRPVDANVRCGVERGVTRIDDDQARAVVGGLERQSSCWVHRTAGADDQAHVGLSGSLACLAQCVDWQLLAEPYDRRPNIH